MPTSTAHVIAFFTALEERTAAPTDPAKTVALEDAINALIADGNAAAKADADAAIATAIAAERVNVDALLDVIAGRIAKERMRAAIGFGIACVVAPALFVAGYHYKVGPGAIEARTTVLETKAVALEGRIDATQSGLSAAEVNITKLQEKIGEHGGWLDAMWPDHDRDDDGIVDRVDICHDTPRGEEVLEGSVDGCSIEQAAWLCTDLPAVPANDLTFPWDMTHCPAGMLDPGERVTCTFNVDSSRTRLVDNNNCQIH